MKILAINPGSTSTKIAVFEDEKSIFSRTLRHSVEELTRYPRIIDQFEFRKNLVVDELKADGIPFEFDAIVGRGGLLKPIPGGVYEVNDAMLNDIMHAMRTHACNLGCLIASELAAMLPGCALNQRAIARRFARELSAAHPGQPVAYEDLNLIICHLGGGISVGAHRKGRVIDVNNALDGEGPFSPERAGTLPAGDLIDLCFSGKLTQAELKKRISGKAGLTAHLGTNNVAEVVARIEQGDEHARLVLDAMIYQIAKSVGGAAVALEGQIDAILLTGGIAYSEYVVSRLSKRVSFLAPVHTYPGEDEMEALALNALGALRGELEVKVYQ